MATAPPPSITDNSVTLTFGPTHTYYGYCTIADVQFEFTNLGNLPNVLSNSSVAQEISYAAITSLQPLLDLYYIMPYLGSNFNILTTLRELNTKLAVAMLIERYFQANDKLSAVAASCYGRVAGIMADIEHGVLRWDDPFGDAVARAELPAYPQASMLTVTPNPTVDQTQGPMFTMGVRPKFDRGRAF